MSMADLELAFQLIDSMGVGDFHGPKSEALIAKAEQALGVTFPPTYKLFLRRFGCGAVPPHEFYGVIDSDFQNSSVPDAIWLTMKYQRMAELPTSLILVSDTGDGGYYAIDRSRVTPDGESQIILLSPGASCDGGQCSVVAGDYGEFFLSRVRQALGST